METNRDKAARHFRGQDEREGIERREIGGYVLPVQITNDAEGTFPLLDTPDARPFDVALALRLSRIVHDACPDAPHDIGIRLAQEVAAHRQPLPEAPG